ncbi:MAG: hypothetical protein ABIG28_02220 [archaeon]
MINKKVICLAFLLVTIILLVSSVSAFEFKEYWGKTKNFVIEKYENSKDKFQKLAGFKEPQKGDTIFRIQIPTSGAFSDLIGHFSIGLLAGLWIWIFAAIQTFIRDAKERSLGRRYRINPFSGIKTHWQSMVAGKLWKVLIIAVGYAIITQIPIINRVVQIITFDFLSGFFKKTFILALEIGFIPSFIEYFMKIRLETKYQKMVTHATKIGAQAGKDEGN